MEWAKIYREDIRNEAGSFPDSQMNIFAPDYRTKITVSDCDNDGDCDLAIMGRGSNVKLYKNENGIMIDSGQNLGNEIYDGDIAFVDYDNDSYLDLFITGEEFAKGRISKIYKNNFGIFQETNIEIEPVSWSSVDWADIDNDSDLDLVIGGVILGDHYTTTRLYRNTKGRLIWDESINLQGNPINSIAFGDYDNDGWIDLAMMGGGLVSGDAMFKIYRNIEGREFVDIGVDFPALQNGTIVWADIDNDGDLDLVSAAHTLCGDPIPKLYLNDEADITGGNNPNQKPLPPTELTSAYINGKAVLSWGYGSDRETPKEGLYYNIRVGTSPGKDDVVSQRYGTPLLGNYLGLKSRFLSLNLPAGTYYWAIQTIDTGLSTSDWSIEKSFDVFSLSNIILNKSSNKQKAVFGETITYTITYKNVGSTTAIDVTIVEVLPEKTVLESGVWSQESGVSYWYDNNWQSTFSKETTKIRWVIPQVLPQSEGSLSFSVRVK
ncbi:MAG: FG-GAP-like repeat-containing protein [bacterium]